MALKEHPDMAESLESPMQWMNSITVHCCADALPARKQRAQKWVSRLSKFGMGATKARKITRLWFKHHLKRVCWALKGCSLGFSTARSRVLRGQKRFDFG